VALINKAFVDRLRGDDDVALSFLKLVQLRGVRVDLEIALDEVAERRRGVGRRDEAEAVNLLPPLLQWRVVQLGNHGLSDGQVIGTARNDHAVGCERPE